MITWGTTILPLRTQSASGGKRLQLPNDLVMLHAYECKLGTEWICCFCCHGLSPWVEQHMTFVCDARSVGHHKLSPCVETHRDRLAPQIATCNNWLSSSNSGKVYISLATVDLTFKPQWAMFDHCDFKGRSTTTFTILKLH